MARKLVIGLRRIGDTAREEPSWSLTVLLNWYIFVIFPKRSPVPGSLRFVGRVKLRTYVYVCGAARTRAKPCRSLNRRLIHVNHGNVARREFIWWEMIIGFVTRYRSRKRARFNTRNNRHAAHLERLNTFYKLFVRNLHPSKLPVDLLDPLCSNFFA